MNTNHEKSAEDKQIIKQSDFFFSKKHLSNLVMSAFATTFGISLIKIPFDYMIQRLTGEASFCIKQSFQSAFTYSVWRTMPTFLAFSMPRSCFAIYSKNSTKTRENELQIKDIDAIGEDLLLMKIEKTVLQASHISTLAFIETFLAHYPEQKLAIDQRGIPYNSQAINYRRIFASGFGLNFSCSLIGLTCLTHVNDYLKKELVGVKANAHMGWGFFTGALSGVTSAIMTYPLKQLKTHVNLGAVSKDGILFYPSSYSVLKQQKQILKDTPIKTTIESCMQKLFFRSVSNALTFGVIIAITEKIGLTPYDDLKKHMGIR